MKTSTAQRSPLGSGTCSPFLTVTGADELQRLFLLYDWLRVEKQGDVSVACGGIFPASEIKKGQKWQGGTGNIVTVDRVRAFRTKDSAGVDHEIYYSWEESGGKKGHRKLAFAFQCRYCLVVLSTTSWGSSPEELPGRKDNRLDFWREDFTSYASQWGYEPESPVAKLIDFVRDEYRIKYGLDYRLEPSGDGYRISPGGDPDGSARMYGEECLRENAPTFGVTLG